MSDTPKHSCNIILHYFLKFAASYRGFTEGTGAGITRGGGSFGGRGGVGNTEGRFFLHKKMYISS